MSCSIKRILQFQVAMHSSDIRVLDGDKIDVTSTCMYSWSTDGVCWTNWVNYATYRNLTANLETDFYLRILLYGSFDSVYVNDTISNCFNITFDTTNAFLVDYCGSANLFNPYVGWDCALQLQEQTANSIVCMFGIPIYYFRVKPDANTADYTFKEYVMHNIETVKQIKLVLPDGMMPSSKPQFSDLDFDFDVDWEVELGKRQFATAFGDTAFPKQRDLIYIPMMKRMWEVNSAYDEKNEGLMWQSTTWKLGLVKWNEKTNVVGMDDIIDKLIVNKYEDVFGVFEDVEQERESGTAQTVAPRYAATNIDNIFLQDAIRKTFTKDKVAISETQLNQKSLIVAKNRYSFLPGGMITYQKGICGDSGVLSFVITMPKSKGQFVILRSENHIVELDDMKLKFAGMEAILSENDTFLVVLQWNKANFTTSMTVYRYIYPVDVPIYRIRPEMKYFDFDNPIYDNTTSYNNDFTYASPKEIRVTGYPAYLANIKYFNRVPDYTTLIKELLKYTTNNPDCVINDSVRPIDTGQGYAVR